MRLIARRVALVALPLALVTGVALAAQPASRHATNAVINACVKKKTGVVRVVTAARSCKRGESRLAWNVQGPEGSRGVNGSAGPA
ncbi:MAG TPA: hypothetical protein VFJ75_06505, partial [Gaiellaceae bacterium]|nr:hypothetical protein [Gaiellaceae bacterium]